MNRDEIIALVKRQAAAWQERDAQAVAADFAPDGVLIAPSGRWAGPEAIRKAAEDFFADTSTIKIVIKRIVIDGDAGAIEWTWTETSAKTGQEKTMEDAIIFVVRGAQVVSWREYINDPVG